MNRPLIGVLSAVILCGALLTLSDDASTAPPPATATAPATTTAPATSPAADPPATMPVLSAELCLPCVVPPATAEAAGRRVTPVVEAYRKVRPAVVTISAEKIVAVGPGILKDESADDEDDTVPDPLARRVPVKSLGSGVIIHPLGYLATNAHVIRCAEKINVTMSDGTKLTARVIIADPELDLAILKIDAKDKALPYMLLGRSDDLMVGESVITIGNPMGYSNSVTTGVVSAVDRSLDFSKSHKYSGLIQTDAPINPGNSGGPLLNVNGELIGINTAIRADAQNIGFAIPIDAVSTQLGRLLDFERMNRVNFGAAVSQKRGDNGDEVVVTDVRQGTPAAELLHKGDRLLELNRLPVRQIPDFSIAMMQLAAGQKAEMKLLRDGKTVMASVTLAARQKPDGKNLAIRHFGLTLKNITPEMAKDLKLSTDCGLLVTEVEKGSPADDLGIKPRDVVFQFDRYLLSDLDDLGTILEDFGPGKASRIGLVRKNVRAWAPIKSREK